MSSGTLSPTWTDPRPLAVLGMGTALPGEALTTGALLDRLEERFAVDVRRVGQAIARRLAIESRHVCRDFRARRERPRSGHRNCELGAEALRSALRAAGVSVGELRYLIGHTVTPAQLAPPNVALIAELVGYHGPFMELRQACTGFANALVIARGIVDAPSGGPVAIVGSETGSVFVDPVRAGEDRGQLLNLLQMGDAAAAIVVDRAPCNRPAPTVSNVYFGQIGCGRPAAFRAVAGGSDAPQIDGQLEFEHDFEAARRRGAELFAQGFAAARRMGINASTVDHIVPHQANGRMAELISAQLPIARERVFVNAHRVGNTGSAAIWLALADLRETAKRGARALVLGAEATKHMFGGFVYAHG